MEQFRLTDEQKAYMQQYVAVREKIRQSAEYQQYQTRLEKMSWQEVQALLSGELGMNGYSWKKWEIISQLLRSFVEKKAIAAGFPSRSLKEKQRGATNEHSETS